MFTYYQIVASAPDPWSEDVMPKLQNASTMNAYFSEWRMLMQKAGAYGRPVIVQVEPDMWAYIQRAHGTNAAAAPVSVASSGFHEVAGYADDAPASRRRWCTFETPTRPTSSLASASPPGPPAST